MKKTRYLRKSIEITLTIISMLEIIFLGMLNDFELTFIPWLICIVVSLLSNLYILKKWGRGVFNE